MGLNARDMQIHFCRVLQVLAEISYCFIQRHSLVSGALLVFIIMYIFFWYIYNFLVYISPFLVCAAIFVRIFWSSEQNLFIYVNKKEKKRVEERAETKYPSISKLKRREMLSKYPSQNATSRRRNFTGRKLDVYGGLEEKAKNLSAVFTNEFTNSHTWIREDKYIMKEEVSLDYELSADENDSPTKQTLHSEPSMHDLVNGGVEFGKTWREIEKMKDEEEAQGDRNKASDSKEDDQKKLMDLGLAELDRNKRLESLIARRRARKLLKLHIENGLNDAVIPREIAPLLIARTNPYNSPREFEGIDGIEMPGSAPSAFRSPFDLPYDPNEEKPVLKGDSFDQEFFTTIQKDMHYCRHESFNYFSMEPRQDLAYNRVRRLPGKGNHDWFEQLISNEGNVTESKAPIPPSEREETTHEEDGERNTKASSMKNGEMENVYTKSNHTSEPDLTTKITNAESSVVLEKPGLTIPKPRERVPNLPRSIINATNINDSLYESLPSPVNLNQVKTLFTSEQISHTPSNSIASDLQVEFSEIGSPTLTVDDSHETNTTTDEESVVYYGDIDKDITSGSEEMWGASFNSRRVHRENEHDISEVHNWRDIASPLAPQNNTDEENAADVSSMSSRSDMPEDTPIHVMSSDISMFGIVEEYVGETEEHHPSNSSKVSSHWKWLVRSMDKNVNHLPHETHSEKPEESSSPLENLINTAQVTNDVNNSAINEQDNISVVRQETPDEVSNNSSSSSSPRSVLTQNTIADQVSSSAYNQEMHLGIQQSNLEVMAQETLTDEGELDTTPKKIQLSMDDPTVESHNSDFKNSQEWSNRPQNSIEESNMSNEMNNTKVYNKEHEEKFENSEEKIAPLGRQDATAAHSEQVEIMNEKSRELFDDKVPLDSLMLESSSDVHGENEREPLTSMRREATTEPFINVEAVDTSSTNHLEGEQHNDLNKNEVILSPNHSSEEVNHLQSESKQVIEDHMEKEELDRIDTMLQNIQLSMDDPTVELHNNDFKHSQECTNHPENSIEESNMSNDMKDTKVYNKELEEKFENNEETIALLNRQDASTEHSIQVEMMNEKSRELFDNKVPLDSLMLESSSDVHGENESESLTSLRREATTEPFINVEEMDTSSTNQLEGERHNDLYKNEAILSPNHSSEEGNNLQSESNQVVEDHMDKEKLDRIDIFEDYQLPMVTKVTNADQVSPSAAYNQVMHLGVQQSNMEVMTQATLTGEGPRDTMPQHIQLSMDDPTIQLHNKDFIHSQNSIEESNTSYEMNDIEVYNKECEEKFENSEEKIAPLSEQDATAEYSKQVEIMHETSRDLFDDKVSLDSLMLESSSDVHGENKSKSLISMRQEATTEPFIHDEAMDTSSTKHLEGEEHSDLNKNEAILSPNHSSEKVNYLQSESKQMIGDHMEKEKLDRIDISEDYQLPIITITNADQVSSSAYNQEMDLGVQQSNMEVMAQATLTGDTMPQNIQLLLDDTTVESHNKDFRHSQEWTNRPENSIEESNMSNKMNDTEVYNTECEENLRNEENSEDKIAPLSRKDATIEPSKQVEMMNEKSRELFDDKVPLDSLMLESSSDVHRENESESPTSMRREETMEPFINVEAMDTSSTNELEGERHNDLNKNEAIVSPNHSSAEVNYLQNESKHVVEDHMEKEKLDKIDFSEDYQLPMVTKVTNVEQELNKNESMVLSEPAGESGQVSNIELMKDPEQVLQPEDVSASKPNDSSKEIECLQKESTDLVE